MATVRSVPFSANLRYVDVAERTVQSLAGINPALQQHDSNTIVQAINRIRRQDRPIQSGFFTVTDELEAV